MPIRTGRPQWAVPFAVCFADRDIASETEAEAFSEERGERELIIAGVTRRLSR